MKSELLLAARLATGVAALAITAGGHAHAQVGMTGYSLQGGFSPSPQVLTLTARGASAASDLVAGCPGYADLDNGGFALSFSNGYTPLRFYLDSEDSPGLLIEGPDGISRCGAINDGGIAHVPMDRILEGDYQIWSLSPEPDQAVSARILIAEYELSDWDIRPPVAPTADSLSPPLLGVVAIDATLDDRQDLMTGMITGSRPASELVAYCSGHIDPAGPHLAVDLDDDAEELSLYMDSDSDGVMMVLAPDGEWYCNDDTFGLNPAVSIMPAPAGRYHVLGGTFGQNVTTEARFYANLGQPIWDGEDPYADDGWLGIGGDPAFGFVDLPGQGQEPVLVGLTLDGSASAADFESGCIGQISPSRPDLVVDVPEEGLPLALRVTSDADTTLLVADPYGNITCIDDTYGLDPEVFFESGAMGEYDIWVGTWGTGDGRAATLIVSREQNAPTSGAAEDRSGADDLWDPMGPDPMFAGIETVLDVWDVMVADLQSMGGDVQAASVISTGPESLEATDVRVHEPDLDEAVTIGQILINSFDVAGLRDVGELAYVDIEINRMDYMPMARAAAAESGIPLGDMEELASSLASMAFRFLPNDGNTDAGLSFAIDDVVDVRFESVLDGEISRYSELDYAGVRSLALTIADNGLVKSLVETQGAQFGMTLEDILAFYDDGVRDAPFPITASDPRGSVFVAIREFIAQSDTGGTLSISVTPGRPMTTDELFGYLVMPTMAEGDLMIDARYVPN